LSLLLNSNEGNKELLLPIKLENINNKKKNSGNLAEKIYDAALQIMLGADISCDVKSGDFAGYVRIVSKDVCEKPEMNQLSANEIRDRINGKLGTELKEANITLNVVCGNIRMNGYVPSEKKEIPASPVRRRKYFDGDLSKVVDDYACVSVPEAAKYLGINSLGALNKVKNGHLHGLQRAENSHIHIPMHDLITYTFNHPRLKQEKPVGSHAFSMSRVDLDEEQFAKYKSEVGEVKTVVESADILGLSKASVHSMLDRSQLHGVKHKSQWYIPKVELEFVKYLKTSKEE